MRTAKIVSSLIVVVLLGWSAALAVMIADEFIGENAGDEFGREIACSNDRLAVGAPFFTNTSSSEGRVYIYRPETPSIPPVILNFPPTIGFEADANFGSSIHFVPDFTDDGVDEILVGAPGYLFGDGAIFLYTNENFAPVLESSGSGSPSFGGRVTSISGFGTDGAPALVGTLMLTSDGGFRGVDPTDGMILFQTAPQPGYPDFGQSMTSIPDASGDGIQELAVGAPGVLNGAEERIGAVLIYDSDMVYSTFTEVQGPVPNQRFGESMAVISDVDGDGTDDLLIGAPAEPESGSEQGFAFVYSGASLTGTPLFLCSVSGPAGAFRFGESVAAAGDVNGDGRPEFAVGDPGTAFSDPNVVRFYAYDGSSCVLVDTITSSDTGQEFGRSLAGHPAGCDLTGDGVPDIAAGTRRDNPGTDAGSVVILAGVLATPTPTPTLPPTESNPQSAQLSLRVRKNGNFISTLTYDTVPPPGCRVTLYGRMVVENRRLAVREIAETEANAQTVEFRVRELPPAARPDGVEPQLHTIAVTTCGEDVLLSNVAARLANCRDSGELLAHQWITVLVNRFREKVQSITSLGTQRKVVRGKAKKNRRANRRKRRK